MVLFLRILSFIWGLRKFLTPTNLVIAGVIGLAAFAWYEHGQVEHLKPVIQQQEQQIKGLNRSVDILNKDQQIDNEFQNTKNAIVDRQKSFHDKQIKIPNTTTDHPFSNPDLLRAASQLRDYQQNSFSNTNTTDSNSRQ